MPDTQPEIKLNVEVKDDFTRWRGMHGIVCFAKRR